jgi:outer membrane protein
MALHHPAPTGKGLQPMHKLLFVSTLMALPIAASAQQQDASGWGIGAGAAAIDSPYAGEDIRIRPIPLLSYEGERFFFRGATGGYHFIHTPAVSFDFIGAARLDGIDVEDLGVDELAARGIDRRLLEDRDDQLDAGLGLSWRGGLGELQLRAVTDVTDTSSGQEMSLTYSYRMQMGSFTVTPLVGIAYLSEDLANYYYGTLDEEVSRGVVDYKPGSAVTTQAGVNLMRPIGEHWAMMGSVRYTMLPDELSDSPLIESDSSASMFLGLTYRF